MLASGSPPRQELLLACGYRFDVVRTDVDETPQPGEEPAAYTLRVARAKADAAASPGSIVLAADTTVALGGRILGKPADAAEAEAMLADLAGRAHTVYTAVVACTEAGHRHLTVATVVRFRALGAAEIRAYVATGDPLDKAGAYGIQGPGGFLVDRVEGSYPNVIGLPLAETVALLDTFGVPRAAVP